jgi:trehalose 6-phosphate synthase/phosphatase
VLLDYDGTLVPLTAEPRFATPDRALLDWLSALAKCATVHVVSGRPREVLELWLGDLDVGLHAEHGFWSRDTPLTRWRQRFSCDLSWMARVERVLQAATAEAPGSFIERKSSSLAWHYRRADPVRAATLREGLRADLGRSLEDTSAEVLEGACVIEVRDARANKGAVAKAIADAALDARIVAAGDDTTDEQMFAALPPSAITIRVGDGPTVARERVAEPLAVRARLDALLGAAP